MRERVRRDAASDVDVHRLDTGRDAGPAIPRDARYMNRVSCERRAVGLDEDANDCRAHLSGEAHDTDTRSGKITDLGKSSHLANCSGVTLERGLDARRHSRTRALRAGLPRQTSYGGISPVTMLPAPTMAPSPILAPSRMTEPAPIHTSCPM